MKKKIKNILASKKGIYIINLLLLLSLSSMAIFIPNFIEKSEDQGDLPHVEDPNIKSSTLNLLRPGYFNYWKTITIPKENITGNHEDFPVLLSLTDGDLYDYTQDDMDDVVFYSNTDSEWLDHEVEYYYKDDNTNEAQYIAWVRLPTLSDSEDADITMYFGNSTMSSEENPSGLWSNDYVGVWHLSEGPTGTISDSTANENDGTAYGSMTSSDLTGAKIGQGLDFDGSNDYIDLGNDASLQLTDELTLEAWVKPDSFSSAMGIGGKLKYTYSYPNYIYDGYAFGRNVNNFFVIQIDDDAAIGSNAYINNNWHYISGTMKYVSSNYELNIFVDGVLESTSYAQDFDDSGESAIIGRYFSNFDNYYWNGLIDEFRISNIQRSDDWIATEYANQNDPESFYTIGPLDGPSVNAPDVIITSPLASSSYDPPSLIITATITDDTSVIDAIATITGGSTPVEIPMSNVSEEIWQCSWDFSGSSYPAQNYTITITAHDSEGYAGNSESVTVTIQKDLTAPNIIFVSPNDGTSMGDPFAIMATIIDSAGNDPDDGDVFATIKYGGSTLFNLELDRIGETNNWTAEWSNISLPDYQLGEYTIDITARDTSYYQNEQTIGSRTITLIDTHAPIVMIDPIYSGPYGQYQSYSIIEIKASITDSKSSIEQAIAIISGLETFNMTMNFNGEKWTCLWNNITSYTNGQYTITIWTTDSEGNVNQQESITVTIKNLQATPPNGDNGAIMIIIGIIAFIGVVGSVGTYGLVRLAKNRKITPNIEDKLLKTRKKPKTISYPPNILENIIREKAHASKVTMLESKNDIESKKIKYNLTPLPVLKKSETKSKIQILDEILEKNLEKKIADEKYTFIKPIGKERPDLE